MNLVITNFKVDDDHNLESLRYMKEDGTEADVFCQEHIQITSVTESSGTVSQIKLKYDSSAEQTLSAG